MKIIIRLLMTILFVTLINDFGLGQMLNQELKYAIEKISRHTIDDCYCKKEMDFLFKQPADKMLPIYENLLYGKITQYNLTTWNENIEYAKRFYSGAAAKMLGKMKILEALNIIRKWIDMQIIPDASKKFEYGELIAVNSAIQAIGNYNQQDDVLRLRKFINHPDWGTRTSLTRALAKIGGKDSIELLHNMMLNDPNLTVRIKAISSLKDCGDESVLPDLEKVYEDKFYFSDSYGKKIIKDTIDAIKRRITK